MAPLVLIKQAGLKEQLLAIVEQLGGWDGLSKFLENASLEHREAALSIEAYTPGIDPAPDNPNMTPEQMESMKRLYQGYEGRVEDTPKEEPAKEPVKEDTAAYIGFVAMVLAAILGMNASDVMKSPKEAVEKARQQIEAPTQPSSGIPDWRGYEEKGMMNIDAVNRFFYWATRMYADKLKRGESVETNQIYHELMRNYQLAATKEWGDEYRDYANPQVWAGIKAAAAKAAEQYQEHHERMMATSILPQRGK